MDAPLTPVVERTKSVAFTPLTFLETVTSKFTEFRPVGLGSALKIDIIAGGLNDVAVGVGV
jgi:hypothetical protein